MAVGDSVFQLVTFQLGEELYGVDITRVMINPVKSRKSLGSFINIRRKELK